MFPQIELLRGAAVFGGLHDDALRLIIKCARVARVAEGVHFFTEGERGDTMYVLVQGRASIYKSAPTDDKLVRLLQPGDCFGEMALIDLYPRSASIMALEDCPALEISTTALHALYERYLEQFTLLHMNIARELSRRLRQSDEALFRCALGETAPGAAQLLTSA